MLCFPGNAEAGMLMPREKLPVLLVVVVPKVVVVSKVAVTVSLLPKPVPLTVTVAVGVPVTFESVIVAVAALAWAARRVTLLRVRLRASTISRESPIVILREERVRIYVPHFALTVLHLCAARKQESMRCPRSVQRCINMY